MPRHPQRRTAPYWVRRLPDQSLHGLAGKLHRLETTEGDPFTDRQDWLLTACIHELEWRAAMDRVNGIDSCACKWCCSPFPDIDTGAQGADDY